MPPPRMVCGTCNHGIKFALPDLLCIILLETCKNRGDDSTLAKFRFMKNKKGSSRKYDPGRHVLNGLHAYNIMFRRHDRYVKKSFGDLRLQCSNASAPSRKYSLLDG